MLFFNIQQTLMFYEILGAHNKNKKQNKKQPPEKQNKTKTEKKTKQTNHKHSIHALNRHCSKHVLPTCPIALFTNSSGCALVELTQKNTLKSRIVAMF